MPQLKQLISAFLFKAVEKISMGLRGKRFVPVRKNMVVLR